TTGLREEVAGLVAELDSVRQALRQSDEEERRLAREASLLRHEITEIEAVAPTPGEDAELLQQRERLRNAARLQRLALTAYAALPAPRLGPQAWRQPGGGARLRRGGASEAGSSGPPRGARGGAPGARERAARAGGRARGRAERPPPGRRHQARRRGRARAGRPA